MTLIFENKLLSNYTLLLVEKIVVGFGAVVLHHPNVLVLF